jgi:hypothetical protein
VLVYARPRGLSDAPEWEELLPRRTFSELPADYAIEDATNYNYLVYLDYVPPSPVHTNGVFELRGFMVPGDEPGNLEQLAAGFINSRAILPPPTARDYVQDGLIAMWDGIENAGWGTHTSDKYSLRELVTGASMSVFESAPDIAEVVVSSNAVDFTRANTTDKENTAYLVCSIDGLADILQSGTVMTIELVAIPDTSFINTMATQRWGLNFSVGVVWNGTIATGGSLRRWWQGGNMSAGFNKRLYYDRSLGAQNGLETMKAWQSKRHTALVASIASSTSNAKDFIDGLPVPASWYDFWAGSVAAPTDYVLFGQNIYNNTIILPSRVYCWRVYSRALTAEEIAHNYKIDKERFNLP